MTAFNDAGTKSGLTATGPVLVTRRETSKGGVGAVSGMAAFRSRLSIADIWRDRRMRVMFITLENESAIANLVVWTKAFEKFRRTVLSPTMMAVGGRIQREGEVVHLAAHELIDLSQNFARIGDDVGPLPVTRGRG